LKSNVVMATIAGLILGVIAELFFALVGQLPLLGCLLTPVALLFGLGLPILIGALAAAWGHRGAVGLLDGALAALLVELVSRVFGFCASILAASSFVFAPRFLFPSVEPAAHTLFTGVWAIGWFVVSLIVTALLGALGAFLYSILNRR
jgi:hypothetical protein